ncbi:hypothetical protein QTP88_025405 [Uroleucon formosanum]
MSNTRSNTEQHKRSSSVALSPQHVNKNRYAPLSNLNDEDDVNTEITDMDIEECIITVENRKTDNSIPQCQNCQRFNHTKNFCKLPPKCVKCPEQHHYSECTKDRNSPPTCVNCNENHPANYKGCKIYKQIKNHSKAKSHKDPPKHLQTIPEPKEQNAFQP